MKVQFKKIHFSISLVSTTTYRVNNQTFMNYKRMQKMDNIIYHPFAFLLCILPQL